VLTESDGDAMMVALPGLEIVTAGVVAGRCVEAGVAGPAVGAGDAVEAKVDCETVGVTAGAGSRAVGGSYTPSKAPEQRAHAGSRAKTSGGIDKIGS